MKRIICDALRSLFLRERGLPLARMAPWFWVGPLPRLAAAYKILPCLFVSFIVCLSVSFAACERMYERPVPASGRAEGTVAIMLSSPSFDPVYPSGVAAAGNPASAGSPCAAAAGSPASAGAGAVAGSAGSSAGGPATKSFYAPIDEDAVHNLNIWLYRDGSLFPEYCSYLPNLSTNTTEITFPNINGRYNIYFLANVGEKIPPLQESELQTYSISFENYSSFKTGGLPMCGQILDYKPQQGTNVVLDKLVGRYMIFKWESNTLKNLKYTFTSGRLKNCAKTVRPWGREEGISGYASRARNMTEIIEDGDFLSEEDIAALNSDEYDVALYYLENCQGRLLGGNTNPRLKNAQIVNHITGDPNRANLCSYLELTCRAETPTITYDNATYRSYMGLDETSDFSVKRATSNYIMLNVISDSITEADWFVEAGEGTITGQILLTETNPFTGVSSSESYLGTLTAIDNAPPSQVVSDPDFYLQKNLKKVYYVYCSDDRIVSNLSQDISDSSSPYVHCTFEPLTFTYTVRDNTPISEEGNNHDFLRVYTCKHWKKLIVTTDYSPDSFPVTFNSYSTLRAIEQVVNLNITSSDGVLSVPIRVGVIGRLDVQFSLSAGNLLQMKMFDPIGYTLTSSHIGIEALTAGTGYWYDNWIFHYDAPFWAHYLKKSTFGSRSYDSVNGRSTYTEYNYPANLSNSNNTLYNTLSLANQYKRQNQRSDVGTYAYASLIYGRINTLELDFECPPGYLFRDGAPKDIPLRFLSTQNLMNGKFGTGASAPRWEGIFVLNGKLLEYTSSSEMQGYNFPKNTQNKSYYLNFDELYTNINRRASAYRDPAMKRYGGTLSFGYSKEGLHNETWWNSFPYVDEDYHAL